MDKDSGESIYLGLGANLSHPRFGLPRETLQAALKALSQRDIIPIRVSSWYRTAPVPASDQPWYVNAVASVRTKLSADDLLKELHRVEEEFGRVREEVNGPRLVDLDLLDYRGQRAPGGPGRATVPHPRMLNRAFVLRPLADLAPDWRHPISGASIQALLQALPPEQTTERLDI